jgi:hypothetical protein
MSPITSRKHLKKITGVNCVARLAHEPICLHELITFIGDDPIGNKPLTCPDCLKLRMEQYTAAINKHRLRNCSFELYNDIETHDDFNYNFRVTNQCQCKSDITTKELLTRFNQIRSDFRTLCAEKTHVEPIRNELEAAQYLLSQGYFQEGNVMKAPIGRKFTLEREVEAIRVLANGREFNINWEEKGILIFMNRNDMEAI